MSRRLVTEHPAHWVSMAHSPTSRWLLAAFSCAGVLLFLVPGHLGLWAHYPFTQLSSMRMLTTLGLVVGALGCLAWAALRPRGTWWRPSLVTAAVTLVVSALVLASLVREGAFAESRSPTDATDLVVLSFNAQGATAEEILEASREADPDVIMLVEAPDDLVRAVADGFDGASAFTNADQATSSVDAVGIVTRARIGTYEQVEGPSLQLGSVAIEGGGHGPSHLAAVHPLPPRQRYAPAPVWREEVSRSVQWCEDRSDAIVGGDFNAVADHLRRLGLERCASATDALGLSARGTWPTALPAPLGADIDHQLSDPESWLPTRAEILTIGGSDHRAVLVSWLRA